MIRSIRVAAVQLRAHDRADFERVFPHVLDRTAEAARDADLVVLPEGTIPAYVLGSDALDGEASERALERIADLARARGCAIVVGAAVRNGERTRNAAILFDRDGSRAGCADKTFLWHFDRRWFEAGDRIEPIRTSLGALGLFVCADGRIPTLARALVDRGAEMLVMPTAWVTSGRDPAALENAQADLMARVRAYENRVPLVAANKCGTEGGFVAYCGKSQIVDADGETVAMAGEREPETCRAEVTIGAPAPHRVATPHPQRRQAGAAARIAITAERLRDGDARALDLLDADAALAPGDTARLAALDALVPAFAADDATVRDPGGLVPYRLAGYGLVVWETHSDAWTMRLARTRALELRLYVVVFDRANARAFAIDPDGAVVCGTFGEYRIASFAFDPRKVAQTLVAPRTDILEGLTAAERASAGARTPA